MINPPLSLINMIATITDASITDTEDLDSILEESQEHINRVRLYTKVLLTQYISDNPTCEIDAKDISIIAEAATFHDIGKYVVPDYILLKPTTLTKEEFDEIKHHVEYGVKLMDKFFSTRNQFSFYAKQIIQNHHERWDGSGYPNHLKCDEIPIIAQIVGLVDVYDALVNKKVYRGAYDVKMAEDMIITGKCGKFNPRLLESFMKVKEAFSVY